MVNNNIILDNLKSFYSIYTDAKLADFLGVQKRSISVWRKGENINATTIIKKCHEIDLNKLFRDDKNIQCEKNTVDELAILNLPYHKEMVDSTEGSLLPEPAQSPFTLSFCRHFIESLGSPIKELMCIKAVGESMYPTIKHGAILLIRKKDNINPIHSYIYLVVYRNTILCKRIEHTSEGYLLVSDNPSSSNISVNCSDIRILAHVIWVGQNLY